MKFILAVSSLLLAFIFIRTSCPTVYLGDSGEMITAAVTLGIGHPPGYPLYMMAAKIFSLFPAGDIAYRINLFSSFVAVFVFLCMYFTSLYTLQVVFKKKPELPMKLSALCVSFIFVFSYMFWFQAVQAKGGVYLLAHAAGLLGIFFCFKFVKEKKPEYFYLGAFIAGFMPAVHQSAGLIMVFVLCGLVSNMKKLSAKQRAAGLIFFLLSFLTPYLYFFIRVKAAPVVWWGEIETTGQILNHIIRKVYFTLQKGPFTADVALFKLRHYYGQFTYSYKIAALLSAAGFVFIFVNSRKIFFVLLAFIIANLAALFYLTGYSYSPFNIYMNSGFYLVVDAALVLAAGAGIYGFASLIKKKYAVLRAAVVSVFLLIPVFYVFSFYSLNDQSRKFMAYDNTLNDLKTLKTGDYLFAEEDFQVFNILYFKYVRHMFPGIKVYDRSANFLDTSIFKLFKDAAMEKKLSVKARNKSELDYMMLQYTIRLERAAEYKVIEENQDRAYYTTIADFPAAKLFSRPYGILFKLEQENTAEYDSSSLLKLYTIRDYFNNKKLDLYYRDVIGRYFVQHAKYAAIMKNGVDFELYRTLAVNFAGGSGAVLNLIAEIYYSNYKDMPMAIEYMENIMRINPYDFAALEVLIRFCIETDKVKAIKWLKHYYSIAVNKDVQNTMLVQINKLNEELKK